MILSNSTFKRILGLHGGTPVHKAAATPTRRGGGGARDVWARPGMSVTFRAELMPGKDASERTFRVSRVLGSLRVIVEGVAGEHTATEFHLTSARETK